MIYDNHLVCVRVCCGGVQNCLYVRVPIGRVACV